MRIDEILPAAIASIKDGHAASDTPALDAELLLADVLESSRAFLFSHPDFVLDAPQVNRYQSLINRRVLGEPIAYILGRREFWSLSLRVDGTVLIPRPDTECSVSYTHLTLPTINWV